MPTPSRLAAIAALVLLACGGLPRPVDLTGRVPAILALTGNAAAGEGVYERTCLGCHGPTGTGALARGIVAEVRTATPGDLATITLNGIGSMGPQGAGLNDREVADLVAWLKATFR